MDLIANLMARLIDGDVPSPERIGRLRLVQSKLIQPLLADPVVHSVLVGVNTHQNRSEHGSTEPFNV
jgi:hypothetical protein